MFVLKSSPTFPSVLSITQACAFFGLDCCAYKANIQTLEKIDKPIILHINDKIDKFVLFEKKQNDVITYFDYIQDKRIRIRTDDFLLIWTNILLIPDKKPVAKNMISKKYIFLILSIVVSFLLILFKPEMEISKELILFLSIFALNGMGLLITIGLILQNLNLELPILNQFCFKNSNFDCKKVNSSKISKLFKFIPLSEVGFVYFSAGIILLIIGFFKDSINNVLTLVFYISLCNIPFLSFLFLYQKLIVKKWCFLCLSVTSVIVVELLTLVIFLDNKNLIMNDSFTLIVLLSIIISLLINAFLRNIFLINIENKNLIIENLRIKRNPKVLSNIWERQKIVYLPQENIASIGNMNAPIEITTLLNPFCTPCKNIFEFVVILVKINPDLIKWNIRFDGILKANTFFDFNRIQLYLMEVLNRETTDENKLKILKKWFSKQSLESFIKNYPNIKITNETFLEFTKHIKNNEKLNVHKVPTIWINNREISTSFFKISDIRYILLETDIITNISNNTTND